MDTPVAVNSPERGFDNGDAESKGVLLRMQARMPVSILRMSAHCAWIFSSMRDQSLMKARPCSPYRDALSEGMNKAARCKRSMR